MSGKATHTVTRRSCGIRAIRDALATVRARVQLAWIKTLGARLEGLIERNERNSTILGGIDRVAEGLSYGNRNLRTVERRVHVRIGDQRLHPRIGHRARGIFSCDEHADANRFCKRLTRLHLNGVHTVRITVCSKHCTRADCGNICVRKKAAFGVG
jgi:hypothetical protein